MGVINGRLRMVGLFRFLWHPNKSFCQSCFFQTYRLCQEAFRRLLRCFLDAGVPSEDCFQLSLVSPPVDVGRLVRNPKRKSEKKKKSCKEYILLVVYVLSFRLHRWVPSLPIRLLWRLSTQPIHAMRLTKHSSGQSCSLDDSCSEK